MRPVSCTMVAMGRRAIATWWAAGPWDRRDPRAAPRPSGQPPPYTAWRCRSPAPQPPSPPSSSRSSCPPSASSAPSTTPSAHLAAPDAGPRLPPGQGAAAASSSATSGPASSSTRPSTTSIQDAYREALVKEDILPLTNADVEVVQAEEGKPLIFKATVQVRPEVTLGDYKQLQLQARDRRRSTTPASTRSSRSCATRTRPSRPVEDRGAKDGDYAVISFVGTTRRRAVRGRHVRADAAHPRPGAPDPGLRGQPGRPRGRRHDRVRHHVPRGLPRDRAGRQARPLRGRAQGAAREGPARPRRRLHRRRLGDFADARRRCGPTSGRGWSATRSTAPATGSPTGSSSTPSPTRPSSCPTCWSTRRSR